MPIAAKVASGCVLSSLGVTEANIDLRIEPRKLILRGTRPTPEPASSEGRPQQILATRDR